MALQNLRGAELFLAICWFIWSRRNKLRHKESVVPQTKLVEVAQQYVRDFQQAKAKLKPAKPARRIKWKPPEEGQLKTNIDGTIFEDLGAASIGIVIRNSSDEVQVALSEIIPLPSSVLALETIAVKRAISFLKEQNFSGFVIEGDSESSILAIRNKNFSHPVIGHLVQDILSSASSLSYFSFSHTQRQGNALAHPESKKFFPYFDLEGLCSLRHS